MNNIQKRFVLFIFGCIVSRILMTYATYKLDDNLLIYVGIIAIILSISFMSIYLLDLRKTGAEVFGDKIWWNHLRPIHSLTFAICTVLAFNKSKYTYVPILIDTLIGLIAFLNYHIMKN